MAFDEVRSVVAKLESDIASGPIVPTVTPHEIGGYLASRYDFRTPRALDEVGADVERMLRTWQVQVRHPRYFGLFTPSVTLASIIGDTLVAMYNPQLATWRTSPAANEIERHTLAWLRGKFGLPAGASASFTSGGAEANLSAGVVGVTRGLSGHRGRGPGGPPGGAPDFPAGRGASPVQKGRAHDGPRRRGVPRGDLLHAGADGRAGRGSVHDDRAVVPAVHRPEALPGARGARGSGVRRDDRAPGADGRRAAGGAPAGGVAGRQHDAAAGGVLHPRRPRPRHVLGGPVSAADRVDVGGSAWARRPGRCGRPLPVPGHLTR